MKKFFCFVLAIWAMCAFACVTALPQAASHGPPQKGDSDPVVGAGVTVRLTADPPSGPVGELVTITAESSGKKLRWRLAGNPTTAKLKVDSSGRWATFSATIPGRYVVQAWTAAGDEPSDIAECVISIGDVKPKVGGDKDDPKTPVKGAFVIIIYDGKGMTPELNALLTGTLATEVKGLGHNWKTLDVAKAQDAQVIQEKNYGKHIQAAGGVPCLLLFVPDGNKGFQAIPGQLPINKNDVLKVIKEKTGA